MTDTIMLEAPARGGRISDLADGQGRILRLHDITASSLGHTSHANQTESPTRTGGRVTIERKPDEGDGPAAPLSDDAYGADVRQGPSGTAVYSCCPS